MNRLGLHVEFYNGLRVTSDEAMEVVKMVLVGKVNPELVAAINQHGRLAVGVSGDDGNLVTATQRDERLGRVGDVTTIDTTVIDNLIEDGFIPVVATVAAGDDGGSFNVNADLVAAELATALGAEKVIFLTDVDGLYARLRRQVLAHQRAHAGRGRGDDRQRRARGRHGPEGRRVRARAAGRREPRPHPQRHGSARAAARGLHRRGRRHDDHRSDGEGE